MKFVVERGAFSARAVIQFSYSEGALKSISKDRPELQQL